uniref:Uncharacterized protein n=1 Tax=Panagrolaimus sp. ES5 TaxID=591445 RepID=A0AC34G511_9BILA
MRGSRRSARALKKLIMAARGSKESKTSTRSKSTSAPTNTVPQTNPLPERLIKIDNLSKSDTNNNNVVSARESTTTATNNLTSTISETGPLMKVVVSPQQIDNLSKSDTNNNNVVSARESTTTATNNLTSTISETGPLMKVVVSPQRGPVELLQSTTGAIVVYTDASLIKDGTAGIGIFFGKDHPLNTTQRL